VTSTEYNNRGEAFKTIDPKAIESRREFDHAGWLTKLIENYVSGPDLIQAASATLLLGKRIYAIFF
jgi:hypothetical protein